MGNNPPCTRSQEQEFMADDEPEVVELIQEAGLADQHSAHRPGTGSPLVRQDPLTGLPTEAAFKNQLEQQLQRARQEPVSATLALLQLENFYEIRTWVGKSEASLLLSDIARELKKALPPSVILCRCEHFEFAALLTNECSVNAQLITSRVKTALQSALSATIPPQLELKCGIGLSQIDGQIPSAEVLFARARHSISLSHSRQRFAEHASMARPEATLQRLKRALKDNNLQMNFQPIVSMQGDSQQRYEVRIALLAPELSVPTDLLFEIAVQNALGEALDRWVVAKALRHLRLRSGSDLQFFINLTLNSLVSAEFLPWLESRLKQAAIAPEQLVFQISEIDVLIAQHHLQHFSTKLRKLGVRLCVTHFGCTQEPYRYLPLVQTDMVKLAPGHLENVCSETHKRRQLVSMVEKLNTHGIRVVAGMVEQMSILPILWKSRINYVQGYCFQAPGTTLNFHFHCEQTLGLH